MSHYENVPQGWCGCLLGEICQIQSSKRVHKNDYVEKGVPFYRTTEIKELSEGKTISNCLFISDSQYSLIKEKYGVPHKGDILISAVGTIGITYVIPNEDRFYFKDGNLIWIGKSDCVNSDYLCMMLGHMVRNSNAISTSGSAYNALTIEKLTELEILLPPLTEQNRIIAELNKWYSSIEIIESGESCLSDTIQFIKLKIFDLAIHGKLVPQDANDEPASELLKRINPKAVASCDNPQYGKVPSSWVTSTVGDVFTINPKTHVDDDTDAAFVPMTCVADGYSNTFEYECKKWGDIKKGFVHFQENDVAVAKISPCLENRKSVVFHDLPNGIGAGTTELNVFRCEEILPEYALCYFKSQMFISSCAGTYNGVVGQQRVAKSFIQELPIGIPPYKEQLRIVSKLIEIFSQLDIIEKSLQA